MSWLSDKLKEAQAQLNFWDGGKTAATVRAARPTAPPAQTIRKPANTLVNNPVTRGFSRVVDQVNPLDNGRTWQQQTPTNSGSSLYQLTHNGVTNVTGGLAKGVAGFSGVPAAVDTAKLIAGQVTHNRKATENATTNLAKSLPQFAPIAIAEGTKDFSQKVATAALSPYAEKVANQQADYARRVLGVPGASPAYNSSVEAYAQAVKGNLLNQHLATAGIQPTDTNSTIARKTIGSAAQTGADIIMAGNLPKFIGGGNSLVRQGIVGGTANAVGGVGGVATQDNPNLQDYAKAAATGFVSGAAIPAAIGGAKLAVRGGKAAVPAVQQAKRELDIRTTPQIMNLHPNERYVLSDYADYVGGRYKPENAAVLNQLQREARSTAQKAGIDITSGSPADRQGRIAQFLDNYDRQRNAIKQGGYLALPEGTPRTQPAAPPINPPIKKTAVAAQPAPLAPKQEAYLASSADGLTEAPPAAINAMEQGKKTRYASKTVPESEYVSAPIRKEVKENAPLYSPETERARYTDSLSRIKAEGDDAFATNVTERLNNAERGKISSQDVADSQSIAALLDAKGDTASLQRATEIYEKLSEHLTAAGQTVQAAAILSKRTPQGMYYNAVRTLNRGGAKVTPELQAQIKSLIDTIAKTQPGTEARTIAVGQLSKAVINAVPRSTAENLIGVWKAGLLSGVKTFTGGVLSNVTFGGLKKLSDVPTNLVDKAISLKTRQRTVTNTGRGLLQGAGKGVKTGAYTLKTGIDLRNAGDKYEQHAGINFKNKVVQKVLGNPANKVFHALNALDQPVYFAELKNSLYDQAKADGINRGLRGSELTAHMEKVVQNPTERLMQVATKDADKAVLGYDTIGSKAIQSVHRGIDQMPGISPAGRRVANAAVDILAPFVKVPSAFISRTIDFTPLGIGKEIFSQVAHKQFDQRALSKAIGEGATGTGIIALGIALTQNGLLSGDYPSKDSKEQQRWRAEGIQPNSVKIGNTWVSLNYLGPIGLLFNAGKNLEDSKDEGQFTQVGAAIGGLGQGLLNQSFLQGFSGFSQAVQDPARNLKSFVNSQGSSVVPAWMNDIGNLTDKYQRQADTLGESVKNRVPGLRQTNKIKQDVYGNPLTKATTGINPINPLRPSDTRTNSVIAEVDRLHTVDPKNTDLQVTPTEIKKTLQVGDKTITLTNDQRYDLQKQTGQATQDAWNLLIKTPEYKKLSDVDKAHALNSLRTDVATVTQLKFEAQNQIGHYATDYQGDAKKLTSDQKAIQDGNISPARYTRADGKTDTSEYYKSPDAEYRAKLAAFQQDDKDGKIRDIERIKRTRELDKLRIGSVYSKDLRDLNSLPKAQVYQYISNNPNGKALADQLLAYNDNLVAAGLISNNPYRDKYGNVRFKPPERKSGGSSKLSIPDLGISLAGTRNLRQLAKKAMLRSR